MVNNSAISICKCSAESKRLFRSPLVLDGEQTLAWLAESELSVPSAIFTSLLFGDLFDLTTNRVRAYKRYLHKLILNWENADSYE